jgi:hypothetical protein
MRGVVVYDNGGETLDRYTIYTPAGDVFSMSENGLGVNLWIGSHADVPMGDHLGKRLKRVPEQIKNLVKQRL